MAGAVTTVTPTWGRGQNVRKIACSWLCDDATGEPLDAVTPELQGWIERVTFVPSVPPAVPPTVNVVDLVLKDEDGAVLNTGTQLNDLAPTVPTHWIPDTPIYVMGALTITVTDQATPSATFDVYVYVSK